MGCTQEDYNRDGTDMETLGEALGRETQWAGELSGRGAARALRRDLRRLRELGGRLARSSEPVSAGGCREWLADNWYLAQREGLRSLGALRHGGRLPRLRGEKKLRLMAVAEGLLQGGELTELGTQDFLRGFQRVHILTEAELGLLVPCLKAALVARVLALGEGEDSPERGREMGQAFDALRLLGMLDLTEMLEQVDETERLLRMDPAGIYPRMDEASRRDYRRQAQRLAKKQGCQAHEIARRALELARQGEGEAAHVGFYLFTRPLGGEGKQRRGGLYMTANLLLTLGITALAALWTGSLLWGFLLLIPLSQREKTLLDEVLLRLSHPRRVHRMALEAGVPEEGRTVCAVSALLTGTEEAVSLARRLELFRLGNRDAGENLLFALLADLPESSSPELGEGEKWLSAAGEEIRRLNKKYGGGFFLLYRERRLCPGEGKYRGWERKRGAILELARFLRGRESSLLVAAGDPEKLRGCAYILTLDGDTHLSPGAAKELIGAMLHPLNRPVVDPRRRVVKAGYGILAPRMSVELESAGKTVFSRLFAGQGGTDPYDSCVGELYMNLLGRSGFAGKGILDAETFLYCMEGRIPEDWVLSHDILEGAYLRCGYMGDVELTDSFPAGPNAWLRRLERWTRGDWQNLPWLLRRELPPLERWRILDNLRRSLVPVMTFLCLLLGLLLPHGGYGAILALVTLLTETLLRLAEVLLRPRKRERRDAKLYWGPWGSLLQKLSELLLLPTVAFTLLGAIVTALWRMTVSHKNMLRWKTAAQADGERSRGPRSLWPGLLAGGICAALHRALPGLATGLLWILSPLLYRILEREELTQPGPDGAEREYLLGCAREIWHYYAAFCTPEEHYLPPDNFQHSPPVGIAHRTSPTNIGLCLLSALAAEDLSLASPGESLGLIGHILDTLEALPKWHGHLYNWTDTRSLETLHPAYVSTVDSGNLAACLVALARGLEEKGCPQLAFRARRLFEDMDFRPLYDERRQLFHIGWDAAGERFSQGWYDLLSSEARLTAYVAIARGDVPRKHWRRLSRAQLEKDGRRGMASWSGTMFEYLMPDLLLPCPRGSLLWESARFCLYCQRKRTRGLSLPWGVSESAFAMLDGALNYRYKAHGVAALALQRDMDAELVISPYSSFLALGIAPEAAVENLRRLEAMGARGELGFWEAVDFSPSRRGEDGQGTLVQCLMAHHLGMSLIAIDNRLRGAVMQRRFMGDPAMQAYSGLLRERIPLGAPVLERETALPPQTMPGQARAPWEREGREICFLKPECCVLSNGFYNIMSTENGGTKASCRELTPYLGPGDPFGHGMEISLSGSWGEAELLPFPGDTQGFAWKFQTDHTEIRREAEHFSSLVETMVVAGEPGEQRAIRLRGKGETPMEATLVLRFEAVLARYEDYVNHPAYYGLGLHGEKRQGLLYLGRLPRGKLESCALAVACSVPMDVWLPRDRFGGQQLEGEAWLVGGRIELRVPVILRKEQDSLVRFALCVAKTEQGAGAAALRVLRLKGEDRAVLPGVCGGLLGLKQGLSGVWALLRLLHAMPLSPENPGVPRQALWGHGVSGDDPILCLRLTDEPHKVYAQELLRQQALLSLCGERFDLVLLSREGGDYRRPGLNALWRALRALGREQTLGARGGVHFVADTPEALRVFSTAGLLLEPGAPEPEGTPENIVMSTKKRPAVQGELHFSYGEDNSFRMDASAALPPRAWSNILTNGEFGCIVTERGPGHMWLHNAREAQLSPWLGSATALEGPEQLSIVMSTDVHGLFADPGDGESLVEYGFGWAAWQRRWGDVRIRSTAFVPMGKRCRILLIEKEGDAPAELLWRLTPLMGERREDCSALRTRREGAFLMGENPRFLYQEERLGVAVTGGDFQSTCSSASWYQGRWDEQPGAGTDACMALRLPLEERAVIVCGTETPETLGELAAPERALALLEETRHCWEGLCGSVRIHTPDPLLDRYMNGWALYQTLACRVLGRSSLYQNGGAFGFRDQLQDGVNLLPMLPKLTRRLIRSAAAHQYEAGDVMHWWHSGPEGDKGVRTRCSDDLLWLPWALCEYVDATGEEGLLEEMCPFLRSPSLEPGEGSRYECPAPGPEKASLLEHGLRALEMVMARGRGPHGLPLILEGDWNDGFDRVGAEGVGESVWLGWFFAHTAERFAALGERLGAEPRRLTAIAGAGRSVGTAANEAWDGDWYLRGFFDDGTPLGSRTSRACQIDSVAQSFSALCREAEPERVDRALRSALDRLFHRESGAVQLFDPPFGGEKPDPGYVASYGPGFRENGGQYTHGALWLAMALLRRGQREEGYALLHALLPGARDWELYGGEPYVLAADVYTAPGHEGRAGWSWYTGSSGWMLRIVTRELLGLSPEKGEIRLRPRLPEGWERCRVEYRDKEGRLHCVELGKDSCVPEGEAQNREQGEPKP